jgi:hypothetical protein
VQTKAVTANSSPAAQWTGNPSLEGVTRLVINLARQGVQTDVSQIVGLLRDATGRGSVRRSPFNLLDGTL